MQLEWQTGKLAASSWAGKVRNIMSRRYDIPVFADCSIVYYFDYYSVIERTMEQVQRDIIFSIIL